MSKWITFDEGIAVHGIISRGGITPNASIQADMPGETEETLYDTSRAMQRFKEEPAPSIIMLCPGSNVFDYCSAEGLIGPNDDPYLKAYHFPCSHFGPDIDPGRFSSILDGMYHCFEWDNARMKILQDLTSCLHQGTRHHVRRYGLLQGNEHLRPSVEGARPSYSNQ